MLNHFRIFDIQNIQKRLQKIIESRLWAKLLVAMVLGASLALFLLRGQSDGAPSWLNSTADWVALPGSIYLALIQMVIVPLVLSSIVLALSSVRQQTQTRTLGVTAFIFVLVSTSISALLGVLITEWIHPGQAIHASQMLDGNLQITTQPGFKFTPETLLGFLPKNPLASILGGDLFEVLIVSLLFGLVMAQMEEKTVQPLQDFLKGTQSLCLKVIAIAMSLAPYAVFGLMFRGVVQSGVSVLSGMAGYLFCIFLGFAALAILYLVWLVVIIKKNPIEFLMQIKEALILAFSLSSSAATMPTTFRVAEENLQVDQNISRLLIPLGTTINMAGSAIWQTTATIFIAQAYGVEVSPATVLMVIFLTVGASIGTPGVPGAGLGVLSSTLRSVGVPATGIPLILGVDRLVDMGCTVLNVMGDLVMCLTAQWAVKMKTRTD